MTGRMIGVGVGPGDPELLTLKAVRLLKSVPVVAYVAANGRPSIARQIAAAHIVPGKKEINLALPMQPLPELASAAYDEGASRIGTELERDCDVAVLCEGDPMFYGSFSQLLSRLAQRYTTEVIPGVTSISAAAAAAGRPLVSGAGIFMALPASLPRETLQAKLGHADAVAILKLGRHLGKVRDILSELGRLEQAIYVERVSTDIERVMPLSELEDVEAPYFALILLPAAGA